MKGWERLTFVLAIFWGLFVISVAIFGDLVLHNSVIIVLFLFWLLPSVGLYYLGRAAVWIYKGFKEGGEND